MTRRETPADRAREDALAVRLERAYGLTMWATPHLADIDRIGVNGAGLFSVWEIKCRTWEVGRYPTVYVDVAKVCAVREHAHYLGGAVSPMLAFGFPNNEVRAVNLDMVVPVKVEINGRTDRGDPADLDPVAHFRMDDMAVVP